jgi:hypothetical protein
MNSIKQRLYIIVLWILLIFSVITSLYWMIHWTITGKFIPNTIMDKLIKEMLKLTKYGHF